MSALTLRFTSAAAIRRQPLFMLLILAACGTAQAAENKEESAAAEVAIRQSGAEFTKAFNRGDAAAIAELWMENGTLADERGEIFKGRKAIQQQYASLFKAEPGAKIEIAIQAIDFPTSAMAIEDGLATVITRHGPPTASRYTAVHVRQADKSWQIASVRETALEVASNYDRLKGLQWLVGTWETSRESTTVRTTIRWVANKSFLLREFTVRQQGVTTSEGLQIIGWDAQAGRVRSWSFDASGGHGSGLWTATADGWRIDNKGQLADGTPTASHDFLIQVTGEPNIVGWRSTQRIVGNLALPDMKEVVLDRVQEKR